MATLSTEQLVTPLHQQMLDHMATRSMRARMQHDYVRHIRAFVAFLDGLPDTANAEDVRRSICTSASTVSALRILFGETLERPDLSRA